MTDSTTLYANGMSARQVAKLCGIDSSTVLRRAHMAGVIRTKSQGMYLRYNPVTRRIGDELVIKLSWTTIRTPYLPPIQMFAGTERT